MICLKGCLNSPASTQVREGQAEARMAWAEDAGGPQFVDLPRFTMICHVLGLLPPFQSHPLFFWPWKMGCEWDVTNSFSLEN